METTPRVEVQPASALIASRLAVDEGTPVISRHQERSIAGTPWSLQTIFYPMQFATEGGATALLVPEELSAGPREGALKYLVHAVRQADLARLIPRGRPAGSEGLLGQRYQALVAIFGFSPPVTARRRADPSRRRLPIAAVRSVELRGRLPAPESRTRR